MLNIFPDQKALLDEKLSTSLAALADDDDDAGGESSRSVALGLAWGQRVADLIAAWRAGDGYPCSDDWAC
jgi:hypothetical protein